MQLIIIGIWIIAAYSLVFQGEATPLSWLAIGTRGKRQYIVISKEEVG